MKTMTLGKKIGLGFAGLIGIAALLGGMAIFSMKSVQTASTKLATEDVPETSIAADLNQDLATAQLAIRSYALTAEPSYLDATRKGLAEVRKMEQEIQKFSDAHPALTKLRDGLKIFTPALRSYEELINQTETKNSEIVAGREKLNKAATDFLGDIEKLITAQNTRLEKEISAGVEAPKLQERRQMLVLAATIRAQGNLARVAVFKSQALRDSKILEEGLKSFAEIDQNFERLLAMLQVQEEIADLKTIQTNAHTYRDAMRQILADYTTLGEIAQKRAASAEIVRGFANEIQDTGVKRSIEAATSSSQRLAKASWTMVIGLVVALMLGIAVAAVIIRGTTTILTRIATGLNEGAEQTASAAGQVSSSSQSLAEGASEQAASLEETSSSLEEMSSMTKRNAENSQKANDLAKQTRDAAEKGATDMKEMSTAMEAIKVSSDDIAKIIKTIDEIAFQTNILALNAAVEAARAGEAGMGFAVVADEVRNLAQRSAQAAKETSAKIEGAIAKTGQGVDISAKVAQALEEIVKRVRQVDELAAEVASASREQSQGIDQVNLAVGQMDKVTQSNAANAEESAAAAEELNAQAETMKYSVKELLKLVGGDARSDSVSTAETGPLRPKAAQPPVAATPTRNGNGHHAVAKSRIGATEPALATVVTSSRGQLETPSEGDFKDF